MGHKSDNMVSKEGYIYDIVFNYEKENQDPINLVIYENGQPTTIQINCSELEADHPHRYFITGNEKGNLKSVRLKYTIMDGPSYDD